MICTTYFLTFFSELIPPTGKSKELFLYDTDQINIKDQCRVSRNSTTH